MEDEKNIKNGDTADASEITPAAAEDNREKDIWRRRSGYIAAVIINGIIMFVLNNLLNWNIPFILESFSRCLWAINLSLGTSIAANFVFIFYEKYRFRHLLEVFTNIKAFISLYIIYKVYPFKFADVVFSNVLRIFLIVAMVITGIGAVYHMVRTVVPQRFQKDKNQQ